jgi:hypothetical protein
MGGNNYQGNDSAEQQPNEYGSGGISFRHPLNMHPLELPASQFRLPYSNWPTIYFFNRLAQLAYCGSIN